jgi:hypothetical protein
MNFLSRVQRFLMSPHPLFKAGLLISLFIIANLLWANPARAAPDELQAGDDIDDTTLTYLPVMIREPVGQINGRVTYLGAPAEGIAVKLIRKTTLFGDFPLDEAVTAQDGAYAFEHLPPTPPDGSFSYYIRFENPNRDDRYLNSWMSEEVYSLTPGQVAEAASFEIANIPNLLPNVAEVSMPVEFQWQFRAFSPSDTYEVHLVEWETGKPLWISPKLGHTGAYKISTFPHGIRPGKKYGWCVYVYSQQGGMGAPFYYWSIIIKPNIALQENEVDITDSAAP